MRLLPSNEMPSRSIAPEGRAKPSKAGRTLIQIENMTAVREQIVACQVCPRLRAYCSAIGEVKRRAYREQTYWARPVAGFGDPGARILALGLAPGAHGANRTGRPFTGD